MYESPGVFCNQLRVLMIPDSNVRQDVGSSLGKRHHDCHELLTRNTFPSPLGGGRLFPPPYWSDRFGSCRPGRVLLTSSVLTNAYIYSCGQGRADRTAAIRQDSPCLGLQKLPLQTPIPDSACRVHPASNTHVFVVLAPRVQSPLRQTPPRPIPAIPHHRYSTGRLCRKAGWTPEICQ